MPTTIDYEKVILGFVGLAAFVVALISLWFTLPDLQFRRLQGPRGWIRYAVSSLTVLPVGYMFYVLWPGYKTQAQLALDFLYVHTFCSGIFCGGLAVFFAYAIVLRVWVRNTLSRVHDSARLEGFLDFLAGHKRYRIIRSFKEYCKSCSQMLLRAERRCGKRNDVCMYTVQTPEDIRSKSPEQQAAYYAYITCTYGVLMRTRWNYYRLIYLADATQDILSALLQAYEFARSLLLLYFIPKIPHGTARSGVSLHLPSWLGMTDGHLSSNEKDDDVDLDGICMRFLTRKDATMDLLSRLDVHLPPGDEFSIAFSRDGESDGDGSKATESVHRFLADANLDEDGGSGSVTNGNHFMGCVRVSDISWQTGQPDVQPPIVSLRGDLERVIQSESNVVQGAQLDLRLLADELADKGLIRGSENRAVDLHIRAWNDSDADSVIAQKVVQSAHRALIHGAIPVAGDFQERALQYLVTALASIYGDISAEMIEERASLALPAKNGEA